MTTLIPGIVLQWPCISNRRWMRLWGPTWGITVRFTALLSPSSIWACKKMAWDSPWGYRPCGCSATWNQVVIVACANNKQHACTPPSIYTHTEPRNHSYMHTTYTHTCIHMHTHTHTHTHTCSYMLRTYVHTYMYTCIIQCSHLCVESTLRVCLRLCDTQHTFICI